MAAGSWLLAASCWLLTRVRYLQAKILKPAELTVEKEAFKETFGEEWEAVVKEGRVLNGVDACAALGLNAAMLDSAWSRATAQDKMVKLGGLCWCALVEIGDKPATYVINGFFMAMRASYVVPGQGVYW